MLRNREGFTLIELLIVVVIIGILAAIALPKFGETRERAYISAMQSDLRNLQTAQEMYYSDPAHGYTYYGTAIGEGATATELGFTASDGVNIDFDAVTTSGYTATASHVATTTDCTLVVGGSGTQGISCVAP